ncbi:MAG: DUF721 domain-containing protein [Oligoflexia bacterium]|nr:DUF721 domain-containing protein [Oligoflexia bacterium]
MFKKLSDFLPFDVTSTKTNIKESRSNKKSYKYISNTGRGYGRGKGVGIGRSVGRGKKGDEGFFDFLSLVNGWSEIVGEMLAKNTTPLKIQNSTLIITTRHAAFALELSFIAEKIKEKIWAKYPILKKSFLKINFLHSENYFLNDNFENSEKEKEKIKKEEREKRENKFFIKGSKRNKDKYHQFSPEYRRALKEAERNFEEITDEKMRTLLISLHIQSVLN